MTRNRLALALVVVAAIALAFGIVGLPGYEQRGFFPLLGSFVVLAAVLRLRNRLTEADALGSLIAIVASALAFGVAQFFPYRQHAAIALLFVATALIVNLWLQTKLRQARQPLR